MERPRYITPGIISRWAATGLLMILVLNEAGPVTALVLTLISLRFEINDYLRSRPLHS